MIKVKVNWSAVIVACLVGMVAGLVVGYVVAKTDKATGVVAAAAVVSLAVTNWVLSELEAFKR